MTDLLQILKFDTKGKNPLAFEFLVDNQAAPFLVSSSKSLLWVAKAPNNRVRAAVRVKTSLKDFFLEVLEEIFVVGDDSQWGNAQPFTSVGIQKAIAHVESYGVGEVECLVHSKEVPLFSKISTPVSAVSWLPPNCLVVVPKDRSYLGFVGQINKSFVSLIHNPSRGIAIARGS